MMRTAAVVPILLLLALAGCSADTAKASPSDPAPTVVRAGSQAPAAARPPDITCDAWTTASVDGQPVAGQSTNTWSGQLLVALATEAGAAAAHSPAGQNAFAVDLDHACAQGADRYRSAQQVGWELYNSDPQRYI
jgi:hypothetical protein